MISNNRSKLMLGAIVATCASFVSMSFAAAGSASQTSALAPRQVFAPQQLNVAITAFDLPEADRQEVQKAFDEIANVVRNLVRDAGGSI
jgi:hypothetical protein